MINFLKLHSSSSGDARRHVPFASIIHKHIFPVLFVSILFLTLFFRPYAAEAAAQLIPEIEPVYETTITNLYEFIKVQLDDTHRQIFDLFLGSYMVGYCGMADYQLQYQYNSDTPIKEWLINCGVDLYNTILSLGGLPAQGETVPVPGGSVPLLGYQQLSPLVQAAMGCALKAKQYNSVDVAFNDITTSDNFPIPLNVDIMYSLNAALGYYGGAYEWQFKTDYYYPWMFTFDYITESMSSSTQVQFDQYLASMSNPHVRFNYPSGQVSDGYCSCTAFSQFKYIFLNTTTGRCYICNDQGVAAPSSSNGAQLGYQYMNWYVWFVNNIPIYFHEFDASSFTYIDQLFNYINNNPRQLVTVWEQSTSSDRIVSLSDFIDGLYYGPNWADRQQWGVQTDLNLDVPSAPTYYPGIEQGLLDLTGLIRDLLDNNDLRQPVINNYYYPDGQNVPVSDMDPAMQNNTLPESGVDIDQNLFAPLFLSDGKKSYISYLWYMTKPLILYTKDLFNCLVFDPVADFAASGPGYFVYGVVGLGLISGLLVKCLL